MNLHALKLHEKRQDCGDGRKQKLAVVYGIY